MKNLALHWKIIIGILAGVSFGIVLSQTTWGSVFIFNWIKPFGTIFINLLKLIAMPLILASLIKGVSDLKDISKLSKIGGRTIIVYLCTTVLAVVIGLFLVNTISPGKSISEKTRNELMSSYKSDAEEKQSVAARKTETGPLQPLIDVFPSNIFNATTNNRNMLQVIFFALFFGIGMILIPEEKSKPVKIFFDSY